MKKTIRVNEIKEMVNNQLSRTDDYATAEFKAGMCTVLERILMDTGNYEGYQYLDSQNTEIKTVGFYSRKYN